MSDGEPVVVLEQVAARVPHLRAHVEAYMRSTGRLPRYAEMLRVDESEERIDVVYPLGEDLFAHVHEGERNLVYEAVEPLLADGEAEALARVKDAILGAALHARPPKNRAELEREVLRLFEQVTAGPGVEDAPVPAERRSVYTYHLLRDVARYGPLQPLMQDPYLEDIQSVGTGNVHVIHKYYSMLRTNIRFREREALDVYVRNLSERIGRPVSDARPIVDATLFDGSRINIVYSDDVSRKGPSFSIRRVHDAPISITQLIAWKTLSAEIAAYLWLCLENAMSVFVCGEAACGKSATLNALLSFIDPRSKLFSAEDTPEVRPPHPVWQRLLTRETGPEEARVRMFDLLRAALRSRPNYIVVGEIRGAEGAVAFQAMQTGHPTVASFHATNKVKMIQRLTADPINIPLTFIDNLNVAVFQQAFVRNGRLVRRITSVDEIEGYSEFDKGVLTRPVFVYDQDKDAHKFKGMNNSYILEKKIAEQHGYEDPRKIYDDLRDRARVLEGMVAHGVLRHDQVNAMLIDYAERGAAALPFDLARTVA